MGIVKWWNDRKSKPTEGAQEITEEKIEPVLSDVDRITNYFAKGGEIVDITNKPRKENDGFAPDHELLTPFNRAHEGTRAGLNALMRNAKK